MSSNFTTCNIFNLIQLAKLSYTINFYCFFGTALITEAQYVNAHANEACLLFYWKKAYLPAAKKLSQGNIFTSVCLSTGGGLLQCMLVYTPKEQEQTPPGGRHPPLPLGGRHPPEQTPPRSRHPPRADTPPGSRPPPGADTHPPWSRHPPEQTPHPPGSRPPPPPEGRLQHMVYERPVRILLEYILVCWQKSFGCTSHSAVLVPMTRWPFLFIRIILYCWPTYCPRFIQKHKLMSFSRR